MTLRWVPALRRSCPDDASHRRKDAAPRPGQEAAICRSRHPQIGRDISAGRRLLDQQRVLGYDPTMKTQTIEIDEDTATALKQRAQERGVTVPELVAELVTLAASPVDADADDVAELDRRWNAFEAQGSVATNEDVVRWLQTWGTPRVFHAREARDRGRAPPPSNRLRHPAEEKEGLRCRLSICRSRAPHLVVPAQCSLTRRRPALTGRSVFQSDNEVWCAKRTP
jgi:predicted transcriptional regulator